MDSVKFLVGLDISREKLFKAKRLSLYDELILADARAPPFRGGVFDLIISTEVVHGLPATVLESIEALSKDSIVLALPTLPEGVDVKQLVERDYMCYRYLLRGFILISISDYKILLASDSKFFKVISYLFYLLKPLIKATNFLEKGYVLAFR